jgi:hypothetical protein
VFIPSLKGDLEAFKVPFNSFSQFFPRSVFEHVVEETNIYALQALDKTHDFLPRSRFHSWKGCNADNIEAMVALEIGMGMCKKPTLDSYCNVSQLLNCTPNYTQVMLRDKYFLLRSFLQFYNNNY